MIGLFETIRSPGVWENIKDAMWKRTIELQLYCQSPGSWHPVGYERGKTDPPSGLYQIEESSEFLKAITPYALMLAGVLKYVQVVKPFLPVAVPAKYLKQFKEDIDQATKLSEKLSSTFAESLDAKLLTGLGNDRDVRQARGEAMRALREVLRAKDQAGSWGGLQCTGTKEGHWLWLCPHHYAEYKD